ncbi:MAG: LysR family transcriptional regulator, partial [Acetatifactor sp.]|nr:LysR family transcriptional regulator [Acetatifactor sp.]
MNQLNLYHIFYTVAQCGNISAAAKKLYISQPAVSKSISRLEEAFASPLLTRSSRGVTLTENGKLLYRQLETAFQAIRQGEEMISRNDLLGAGSLSIGVSATLCKYALLPYL